MEDAVQIKSDGINVYVTLQVKSKAIGKIILTLMITGLLIFLGVFISSIKTEEVGGLLIPLLLLITLTIFFPVRYLLWNLYGTETLIVNTKCISFNYDYGVVRTNLKTVTYDRLGTGFELVREEENQKLGRLVFYNYRKQDNIPEIIHYTSVLINSGIIEKIDEEIQKVFVNEFNESRGFIGYYTN